MRPCPAWLSLAAMSEGLRVQPRLVPGVCEDTQTFVLPQTYGDPGTKALV